MIEIFRTSVNSQEQAASVLRLLKGQWPEYSANFDLEDCDRKLRIESAAIENGQVISLMYAHGYACEVLT